MKRFTTIFLSTLLLISTAVSGQDSISDGKLRISVEIYSKHLWRGSANGTTVSLQPSLEYQKGRFTTGAWGAWCPNGSYTELDLYLSWSAENLTFTLYDYFCPVNPVQKFEFFEIAKGRTRHTFDLNAEYANPEKHPFALLAAAMVYGDDLNPENGRNNYSTYIEPSVSFTPGKFNLRAFTGFTPFSSYYANKASFINTGISVARKIPVTHKYAVTLKSALVYNPFRKQAHFTLGVKL